MQGCGLSAVALQLEHVNVPCLNIQDGKTVDLSEIVDVRLEFDDPTLMLVRPPICVHQSTA
jgi:hypothetical protein